jgi:hypothetical protein
MTLGVCLDPGTTQENPAQSRILLPETADQRRAASKIMLGRQISRQSTLLSVSLKASAVLHRLVVISLGQPAA